MTKKILLLLIILATVFFGEISMADVIFPGQRPFIPCIKIDNLSSFPEINLIAVEKGPLINEPEGYRIYRVVENQCLEFQYKMNRISIFWNFKGKLKPEEDMSLLKDIESGFRMIEENDPLVEEEIIYSLIKTETQDIQLYKSNEIDFKIYKSKEIKKFKDGQIKVAEYNNPYEVFLSPTISHAKVLIPARNIIVSPSILPSPKATKIISSVKKKQNILLDFICWIRKFFNLSCD